MTEARKWLVLIYKVPSEPTRLRATVWRRLKALGAVYLQNSVAVFPETTASERAMRSLHNEIGELGGAAQLLRAEPIAGESEIVDALNAARDEEYTEVVSRCEDFLAEVEKETTAEKFTYAELEEIDEDLAKLRSWLEKVRTRDVLGAAGARMATDMLERCGEAFEEYTQRVYKANPEH